MPRQVRRYNAASDREPVDEKVMHLVFFLMCLLPLAVSALILTDGAVSELRVFGLSLPLRSVCYFKLVTGYRCPVCGMTRCFAYMSHGNIAAAWHMSHAGIPMFFLCAYESVYRLSRLIFGKFRLYHIFKTIETVMIIIVCAAVAIFFLAQFVNPAFVE